MQDKYYSIIKEKIINVESTERVKNYTINRIKIENYYEIGKIIIEAQGGKEKAKYGNNLMKEYSIKLTKELGKGYSWRNLYNMRQFYLIFSNRIILQALPAKLSWTHIIELLKLEDINEIKYYIDLSTKLNLDYRELHKRIKNKEYENLDIEIKNKIINNTNLSITDSIVNPIIIDNVNKINIYQEKILHKLIMEQLPNFLNRLGEGYMYVSDEYRIKIGNKNNYIDFLLYNKIFKSYVVVELKINNLRKQDIGQITYYINYIDDNLKDFSDEKTIGIIIGYKDNDLIMKYVSDSRVIFREFLLN